MDHLNSVRMKLFASIGDDNKKVYLRQLQSWIMGRQSKEEFDTGVQSMMISDEQIHLHNEFLLATLNKGFHGTSNMPKTSVEKIAHHTSKKRKRSTRYVCDKANFEPLEIVDNASTSSSPGLDRINCVSSQRYAAQELFLPDTKMITGRLLVCAWTEDLKSADENIAEFVLQSAQIFLKNIITAILTRHRGYKVRAGVFQHGFGCDVPNPWLRNTNHIIEPSADLRIQGMDNYSTSGPTKYSLTDVESQNIFASACSYNKDESKGSQITLRHLYNTLKYNPGVIAHHPIYSTHIEKILMRLKQPVE